MAPARSPRQRLDCQVRLQRLEPIVDRHKTSNYLAISGGAYRLTGRYDEAIAALKKALGLFPKSLLAHQHLAVIYAELGRDAEAQAEVAEILQINPKYSLDGVRQIIVYKDPAEVERYLAALRKAGLK